MRLGFMVHVNKKIYGQHKRPTELTFHHSSQNALPILEQIECLVKGYPIIKYFPNAQYKYVMRMREAEKLVEFMKDANEPPSPPPPATRCRRGARPTVESCEKSLRVNS
uniref:Uncharacterized protein n=1 Tax=Glossina palpalis gambiensis TaxID=67801 RepID=A0A1B0BET5_9MUSC